MHWLTLPPHTSPPRPRCCRAPAPCRQKLQARVKELDLAKKKFLDSERARMAKQAKEGLKEARVRSAGRARMLCSPAWV